MTPTTSVWSSYKWYIHFCIYYHQGMIKMLYLSAICWQFHWLKQCKWNIYTYTFCHSSASQYVELYYIYASTNVYVLYYIMVYVLIHILNEQNCSQHHLVLDAFLTIRCVVNLAIYRGISRVTKVTYSPGCLLPDTLYVGHSLWNRLAI